MGFFVVQKSAFRAQLRMAIVGREGLEGVLTMPGGEEQAAREAAERALQDRLHDALVLAESTDLATLNAADGALDELAERAQSLLEDLSSIASDAGSINSS